MTLNIPLLTGESPLIDEGLYRHNLKNQVKFQISALPKNHKSSVGRFQVDTNLKCWYELMWVNKETQAWSELYALIRTCNQPKHYNIVNVWPRMGEKQFDSFHRLISSSCYRSSQESMSAYLFLDSWEKKRTTFSSKVAAQYSTHDMYGGCYPAQVIEHKNVLSICPVFLTGATSAHFNWQQFLSHLAVTLVFKADYLEKLIS